MIALVVLINFAPVPPCGLVVILAWGSFPGAPEQSSLSHPVVPVIEPGTFFLMGPMDHLLWTESVSQWEGCSQIDVGIAMHSSLVHVNCDGCRFIILEFECGLVLPVTLVTTVVGASLLFSVAVLVTVSLDLDSIPAVWSIIEGLVGAIPVVDLLLIDPVSVHVAPLIELHLDESDLEPTIVTGWW